MTVFVAHALADREAAESLEKYVERRGQFVELDDGQAALRPVSASDAVVLLSSGNLLAAPERTRLEQRALDAWAEERLVIVRLDAAQPPVGFRDLPLVKRGDWTAAAQAVQRALARSAAAPAPGGVRKGRGWIGLSLLACVALVGVAASWVAAAIWLVNRIGPVPGGWPELRVGLDAFGERFGLPYGSVIVLGAAVAGAIAAALLLARGLRGLARSVTASRPLPPKVLVLHAEADRAAVAPLLRGAAKVRAIRLRREDVHPRRLAERVREAARCVVACSPRAYADDRLKRALYMADRCGAPLVAVYLTADEPPADFVHFLAGARGTKLYETPTSNADQAMLDVLGADS